MDHHPRRRVVDVVGRFQHLCARVGDLALVFEIFGGKKISLGVHQLVSSLEAGGFKHGFKAKLARITPQKHNFVEGRTVPLGNGDRQRKKSD